MDRVRHRNGSWRQPALRPVAAAGGHAWQNAAALAAGLGWIAIGRLPQSVILQRSLALVLLALLFVPLVTGPTQTAIGGAQVTRWIPLGPITVNAGLLALPAILVLAVRDEAYAPPILFTATAR